MSKLLYSIFVINDSDPANPDYEAPKVRLSYLGGGTGTPQGRIYKTGDPPPAFANIGSFLQVAADPGETYQVEYKDNSTAGKLLAVVNVNTWVSGCFEDHITINWIRINRFSGKVQIDWFGSPAISGSIDDGATWKNLIFSGGSASAEWTNAELDLLGFGETIPDIKTRRTYLQNEKNIDSFEVSSYPGFSGPGYTLVGLITDTTSGLAVNDVVSFQGAPGYTPATIVAIPGIDYIVIQHPFQGTEIIPGAKLGLSVSCVTDIFSDFFIGDLTFTPFTLSETHSDVTVEGGNDGSINLTITNGSGSFSFVWDDGPTTQNRSGLGAGEYTVTVTDDITGQEEELTVTITEPSVDPVDGTFLHFPFMNSFQMVDRSVPIDDIENPQALDNRLLCEQYYHNVDPVNYFNKICRADTRLLQFHSDYANFKIELRDYNTDEVKQTIGFVMKEQNIGIPEDFPISIRNHTGNPGQTRIYFGVGPIPIPLKIGDAFTIYNNLDGFNGNYTIVGIENDFTLGYQYLVINKNYSIVATSSSAVGRFFSNAADFNVYESIISFATLDDGDYYLWADAINLAEENAGVPWQSEPFSVAEKWKGTNLIEGRCIDNGFDVTWTTGFICQLRVESHLLKRTPGGERSVNRNADFSLTKTSAKKIRGVIFETFFLPPYLHEKLSTLFDCDSYTINKVAFQSQDAYAEPKYTDGSLLPSSDIKVEQLHWFGSYNSDDIGTVNNGGFLITEQGFIKL